MTIGFQENLLKFLVQSSEGSYYINTINDKVFDVTIHKIAFDILKDFYRKYNKLPTKVTASQLIEDEIEQTKNISDELANELREFFHQLYIPIDQKDIEYVRDHLVQNITDKRALSLIKDFTSKKISFENLSVELNKLTSLKKNHVVDVKGFVIEDRYYYDDDIVAYPTFLNDLNNLTKLGGFYSPQLIVFMSGPKHFKTGTILKLVVEYARMGMKVYYADNENGQLSIRLRTKQAIMECTYDEMIKDPDQTDQVLERFKKYFGGDIFIDHYGTATIKDVKNRLDLLKEERGFIPDIIVWDSLDGFLPSSYENQHKDKRLQIQAVYSEAIALNNELGCFSITPSQVNRQAISKKTFDMKDISEDFGKVMLAHAIFAICATPEELDMGIRRIVPVAQRDGMRYDGKNQCIIYVDETKANIKEVDKEEYLRSVNDD